MTISKRIGISYAIIAAVSVVLVTWLGYHEFVEEAQEFAAAGVGYLHADTTVELSTVCFFGLMPVLLGFGWWWIHRVLAPLRALCTVVEKIGSHNLQESLPRTGNGDEVDKLSAAFSSMAARLDASFQRIHEFTLHASHELKTPLTVMRLRIETALREGEALPPAEMEWMEGQLNEVKRLAQIVDSLTLLTKADAGMVELEEQPVQLDELVEDAFEDAQALAQPHEVRVTLGECTEAVITGDRQRLRQLLLILTDNAVKYNQPGGTIDISLRNVGNISELRVTNTGDGFHAAIPENVFDRFVRGQNAQRNVEGCGLGLTIAQWIVQTHGGTIQLLAEPQGRTTALVRLPACGSFVNECRYGPQCISAGADAASSAEKS